MPDQILLEFYEQRPTRFSTFPARVKVAEIDAGHMTVPQIEKLLEIEEMLGRTFEITRMADVNNRSFKYHYNRWR